jgi:hypothetical protein
VPEGCVTPEALKVGVRGYGCWDTHVEQVIDDGKMLARITFNKLFRGTATDESAWVMMKCKTTGITDGKRFGSWELDKVLGTAFVKVTGTTTYRTAGGSTKTVFVVEPMYRGNLMYTGDDLAKADVATFDKFIAETQKEIDAIQKAAKADEETLRTTKDPKEKARLEGWRVTYTDRIADQEWLLANLKRVSAPAREKDAAETRKAQRLDRERAAEQAKRKAQDEAVRTAEAQAAERLAGSMLKYARELADAGMTDKAREKLRDVIKGFPKTAAASMAKQMLDKLGK